MSDENSNRMNINWFPGHMAKTRKQILEDLKLVDVVIEILDARIPVSSQNPEIRNMLKNKNKIIALNKSDLADPKSNLEWIKEFSKNCEIAILTDSNTGKGINEVLGKVKGVISDELEKSANKGRIGRKARIMIVGIPNVGKSSFINRVVKKISAEVGNKPGVTKRKQWIRLENDIELLDTPGVLWPKFESEEVALNLSYVGTIKDEILETTEISYHLTKFLLENYRENLLQRYSLDEKQVDLILNQNQEENQNIYEVMQMIGRKRGAITSGAVVDDDKTSRIILDDFRTGKLGKITLEKVK